MATGKRRAAAALFVTMLLIRKVARYTAPNKPPSSRVLRKDDEKGV
jgi:hypothetical protein